MTGMTGNEPPHDPRPRALRFGAVAANYEQYRMGYPDEVADAVLAYAGRPIRSAVEVGAGTGKATRCFAARGIRITALEPDTGMAAVLRTNTAGLPVTCVVSSFEQFHTDGHVDLLFAAAAWHWTDPLTRWRRAYDLLASGGVLAMIGRPCELADADLATTVDDILDRRTSAHGPTPGWSMDELTEAVGFTDPVQQHLHGSRVVTAGEYLHRLTTTSGYLMLDARDRATVDQEVLTLLPERVELDTTTRLVMAARR